MTTISLMLLLASCTDGSPLDTNPGADADTDADVTFDIVLPMAATVTVDEIVVPCDESFVCTVNAEGDGTFEINVTHDTYYFIPKQVVVTNGVPSTSEVAYATGGCASDASWNGTSWCDDWVMSEYQVTVQAECCDEQDRCYDTETGHGDLDGDGVEEAMLDIYGGGAGAATVWNASGSTMTSFDTDQSVNGYGNISSDLSTITIWYDIGNPDLFQKIFTCD